MLDWHIIKINILYVIVTLVHVRKRTLTHRIFIVLAPGWATFSSFKDLEFISVRLHTNKLIRVRCHTFKNSAGQNNTK